MTEPATRSARILARAKRAGANGQAGAWIKLHTLAREEKTIRIGDKPPESDAGERGHE